jgi:hypothetical protein
MTVQSPPFLGPIHALSPSTLFKTVQSVVAAAMLKALLAARTQPTHAATNMTRTATAHTLGAPSQVRGQRLCLTQTASPQGQRSTSRISKMLCPSISAIRPTLVAPVYTPRPMCSTFSLLRCKQARSCTAIAGAAKTRLSKMTPITATHIHLGHRA